MKKLLFFIFIISCYNCSSKKSDITFKECNLVREDLEKSSMRKFLETSSYRRDILNEFIANNSSSNCFLSIKNDDILYAFLKNGLWEVNFNNEKYSFKDDSLIAGFEKYSKNRFAYKIKCPDDYIIYDSNNNFHAIWVKELSEIKFLFYVIKGSVDKLSNSDKTKIQILLEIEDKFKINSHN